jgi:hypothetical protein
MLFSLHQLGSEMFYSVGEASADPRKRKKGKKSLPGELSTEKEDPDVVLFADSSCTDPISGKVLNREAWPAAAVLRIGDTPYSIAYNPPTITSLLVQTAPLVGHTLLATARLQSCDLSSCAWEWRRVADAPAEVTGAQVKEIIGASEDAPLVGMERAYAPTPQDVGARLRVTCVPGVVSENGMPGDPATALSGALPMLCPMCSHTLLPCIAN